MQNSRHAPSALSINYTIVSNFIKILHEALFIQKVQKQTYADKIITVYKIWNTLMFMTTSTCSKYFLPLASSSRLIITTKFLISSSYCPITWGLFFLWHMKLEHIQPRKSDYWFSPTSFLQWIWALLGLGSHFLLLDVSFNFLHLVLSIQVLSLFFWQVRTFLMVANCR